MMKFGVLLFLLGVAQGKFLKFIHISPIFSVFITLHAYSFTKVFNMLNENVPRVCADILTKIPSLTSDR